MPQDIQNSHGMAAGIARNSHGYGDKAYRSHIIPGLWPAHRYDSEANILQEMSHVSRSRPSSGATVR
jgi:hypothetical protein